MSPDFPGIADAMPAKWRLQSQFSLQVLRNATRVAFQDPIVDLPIRNGDFP